MQRRPTVTYENVGYKASYDVARVAVSRGCRKSQAHCSSGARKGLIQGFSPHITADVTAQAKRNLQARVQLTGVNAAHDGQKSPSVRLSTPSPKVK